MRKVKFIAIFLIASMFVVACTSDGCSEYVTGNNVEDKSAPKNQRVSTEEVARDEGGGDGGTENVPTANPQAPVSLDDAEKSKVQEPATITERMIIRNANLQLETNSPEQAQQKITAIANDKKGFVITSTQNNTNSRAQGRNSVSMQIRVPSDSFQESLEEIRKTADRVIVETVSGQDVTEQFVDIQARLKTKKALEERYLEIMKRANTVKDALEVEAQLANVRTEIERIEGRKRFLENQSSLSTITIELQTPVELTASSTGFFYELKQAISDGFEAALTFILFLVRVLIAMLPFLLLILLPLFLILRYFFRKYKRKITARRIVEEELKEEEKIIDVE